MPASGITWRDNVKRTLLISSLLLWLDAGHADQLFTVEMPWGTKVELEMVWIEPGTFTMGTTKAQEQLLREKGLWLSFIENERPAHKVTISRGFYLGKYEITQKQWKGVMGTAPWIGWDDVRAGDAYPAVYISWHDAQQFVQVLNQAAGDSLYRLPTEAEWEYTCRAGTNTLWSFGDDERQKEEYTWYEANAWGTNVRYAHQVGTKRPNPWSLHDMHGNVWEWCQDWHGPYTSEDRVDPMGPPHGKARIGRGGAFSDYIETSRSAFRNRSEPEIRYGIIGARLVRRK
jgi:formylglycine-generating enzyme